MREGERRWGQNDRVNNRLVNKITRRNNERVGINTSGKILIVRECTDTLFENFYLE